MGDTAEFRYRGSIVRIRIRNFMTYTDTELKPGPNLNMILGPNGTGKSAVVCCIIIGLAGEVSLTGRGGSAADFVKKDTNSGSTEIELFNDHGKNYIVERKITITGRSKFKIDHKSDWKINGKSVTKSEVQALMKKLNIKVDNLCQFLPQDSVTQFVKMNTCELLLNTLKAAGDNQLVEDHQKLVDYTKRVEEKTQNLDHLRKSCKENEVNAKRLESEVHQLRHREALVKEKSICAQKIHYVRYQKAKTNCDQAQTERNKLKVQLKKIESSCEPFRRSLEMHKAEESRIRQSLEESNDEVAKVKRSIQTIQDSIEKRKTDCQEEFAKFKRKQDEENQRASSIRLKQQELEALECRLNETRDVDCSREIRKVEADLEKKKKDMMTFSQLKADLEDKSKHLLSELDAIKREITQTKAVSEKKTNLLKARFPDAHKVLEWLAKNQQKFKQRIFTPIMCEINVKEPKFNRIVENGVPRQELSAFVCESAEDLRTFTRAVRDELKIRPNVILAPEKDWDQFDAETANCFNASRIGLQAQYLKDLIDAPDPIMRYLCASNGFHKILVAESCSEVQLKQLLEKCPRFYVGNTLYIVSRSKYDNQTMTVSDPVRDALHLLYSLDRLKLNQCNIKYTRLSESLEKARSQRDDALKDYDRSKREWEGERAELSKLKSKQDEKTRLEALIKRAQDAIERLKTERVNVDEERKKLQLSIEKINKHLMQNLEKLGENYSTFIKLKELHMANLLLVKVATRNHRVASKKYGDAQKDSKNLKASIVKANQDLEIFQQALSAAKGIAEEKIPGFTDEKLNRATQTKFSSVAEETEEDLLAKREELATRIQRIYKDANNSILNEFNKQNEELKDKRFRIGELETEIKKIDVKREQIKQTWVPRLEEVIEVIDKNYRDFMSQLSYGGQVKLHFEADRPNNFAAYGIMILVKYRDNEQLIPLSSTRQSGGERSVATMIYMLALQTKTTAPFRCVDEINQGMDKDNERKVFELLVKTADSSSSQYFLVSPKLLSNLPYSEKMKIHVVFNGKRLDLAWNKLLAKRFKVE